MPKSIQIYIIISLFGIEIIILTRALIQTRAYSKQYCIHTCFSLRLITTVQPWGFASGLFSLSFFATLITQEYAILMCFPLGYLPPKVVSLECRTRSRIASNLG